MKTKNVIIIALLVFLVGFASCKKDHDIPTGKTFAPEIGAEVFIGDWGVERIEYYSIDVQGNPIESTLEVLTYDPNDIDNGIQLIFREDKSGELRDYSTDSITIKHYTYSYDEDNSTLYMNMEQVHTYMMKVSNLSSKSFIYENEYRENYMEKAYLKRISYTPSKSASEKVMKHSYQPGPVLDSGVK